MTAVPAQDGMRAGMATAVYRHGLLTCALFFVAVLITAVATTALVVHVVKKAKPEASRGCELPPPSVNYRWSRLVAPQPTGGSFSVKFRLPAQYAVEDSTEFYNSADDRSSITVANLESDSPLFTLDILNDDQEMVIKERFSQYKPMHSAIIDHLTWHYLTPADCKSAQSCALSDAFYLTGTDNYQLLFSFASNSERASIASLTRTVLSSLVYEQCGSTTKRDETGKSASLLSCTTSNHQPFGL